jgi:hypothetical protein
MGKVRQMRDETRVHDGTGASIASITAGVKGMVPQLSHCSNWKKRRCSAREELCQINALAVALERRPADHFAAHVPQSLESGEHFR